MKITCISAANVEAARNSSASVRTCEMVRDLILESYPHASVEVVPLLDYNLSPCCMCGRCQPTERCQRGDDFNHVFEKMLAADALFVVVPHYAPLPSKLMILFEKMQEIAFLNWCANQDYRFPLYQRPAGVIAHGGQTTTPEVIDYYKRMLVDPVAMALASVSMNVIGADDASPRGVAFGIRSLAPRPGSIFVDITHDWDDIRQRITPLVHRVAAAVA